MRSLLLVPCALAICMIDLGHAADLRRSLSRFRKSIAASLRPTRTPKQFKSHDLLAADVPLERSLRHYQGSKQPKICPGSENQMFLNRATPIYQPLPPLPTWQKQFDESWVYGEPDYGMQQWAVLGWRTSIKARWRGHFVDPEIRELVDRVVASTRDFRSTVEIISPGLEPDKGFTDREIEAIHPAKRGELRDLGAVLAGSKPATNVRPNHPAGAEMYRRARVRGLSIAHGWVGQPENVAELLLISQKMSELNIAPFEQRYCSDERDDLLDALRVHVGRLLGYAEDKDFLDRQRRLRRR